MNKNVIFGQSLGTKVVITVRGEGSPFKVERLKKGDENWQVWTESGFSAEEQAVPFAVMAGDILDSSVFDGLYTYRLLAFDTENPIKTDYAYSNWVRCGKSGPVGYTFNNYTPAPDSWGEAICPDDLRYTYLWGTDFKATNGMSFSDEQIRYFIDSSLADIERRLNITIKKVRVRCNPETRNLQKGVDYDVEEGLYEFKFHKIQRYGLIATRRKPILKLHKLILLNRMAAAQDLAGSTVVDKTKGLLKMLKRPLRPSDTARGIQTAIGMYGGETFNPFLFYEIDYDAGFASCDDIPPDLREAIGKNAAISLLNIIGDGLMSGFSSSSLSMDGMSESFSSTQSATSAYFGARIKVYEDELIHYIEEAKRKFGHLQMGSI